MYNYIPRYVEDLQKQSLGLKGFMSQSKFDSTSDSHLPWKHVNEKWNIQLLN